ncbi:MAG TPA: tRNA epoxyqueuosine(34) reductase QueG [Candidatus Latescibacteria bacterium]|nr:tRNA epoxyqueuosine(34) reductase QueG [Candidatus Latescibacterota bacterium]
MGSDVLSILRRHAQAHGLVGPFVARKLTPDTWESFCKWLDAGFAGDMVYLGRRRNERRDVRYLNPRARSLAVFALPYSCASPNTETMHSGLISPHAMGEDYHHRCRNALKRVFDALRTELGTHVEGWIHVDTAPILERDFARQAGLGWVGKNTLLINPDFGSRFHICEIALSIDIPATPVVVPDGCGACTRCLDSCPTGALVAPRVLDARRCISYLTIESKGSIPRDLRPALATRLFGCDACQEVCPWNQKATVRPFSDATTLAMDVVEILTLDEESFRSRFRSSPFERTGRTRLLRNAAVVAGNLRAQKAAGPLLHLLKDTEPLLREHAAWALARVRGPEMAETLQSACERETDAGARSDMVLSLRDARES